MQIIYTKLFSSRPCRDVIIGHNTGISLLLSMSATRPMAVVPVHRWMVWRKKVAKSSTLNQAGD